MNTEGNSHNHSYSHDHSRNNCRGQQRAILLVGWGESEAGTLSWSRQVQGLGPSGMRLLPIEGLTRMALP